MSTATTTNRETRALERVERAAEDLAAARAELDAALVAGKRAGLPLRTLAGAAGLSKEWVRRIAAGTA